MHIANALASTTWPLSHWMIAYIYLKVIIEARALLDPTIYSDNKQKLQEVSNSKRTLQIGTAVVVLLCVIDAWCFYTVYYRSHPCCFDLDFYTFINDVFVIAMILIWLVAIRKLLREVKAADKLVPNRRLFMLHQVSITAFSVTLILQIVLVQLGNFVRGDRPGTPVH